MIRDLKKLVYKAVGPLCQPKIVLHMWFYHLNVILMTAWIYVIKKETEKSDYAN